MDKSWLLDHRIIPQINQCRRLIQAEFGVKLRLTDEDLVQRLGAFTAQSRSTTLQRVWKTLKEKLPATAPPPAMRLYRGQPVVSESPGTSASISRKKQVIYRGQRVAT